MYSRELTRNEWWEREKVQRVGVTCNKLAVTIKRPYRRWGLSISITSSSICFVGRAPNTSYCVCMCKTYSKENISIHDEYIWLFVWVCIIVVFAWERCVYLSQPRSKLWWPESSQSQSGLCWFCTAFFHDGLFLVDGEQIWTLCLWFCDFWACSLSKHEWKKRMWGQTGCYTCACFSSRVYKKMTGFVIMTVHGEAPW